MSACVSCKNSSSAISMVQSSARTAANPSAWAPTPPPPHSPSLVDSKTTPTRPTEPAVAATHRPLPPPFLSFPPPDWLLKVLVTPPFPHATSLESDWTGLPLSPNEVVPPMRTLNFLLGPSPFACGSLRGTVSREDCQQTSPSRFPLY